MKRTAGHFGLWTCLGLSAILLAGLGFRSDDGQKLSVNQLIEQHLKSIAPRDRLKARQSFALRGDCDYRILMGGALSAEGMTQIASKGDAYNILFQFSAGELGGAEYLTNGKKSDTRLTSGAQINPFRNFLEGYGVLQTEGLLGGELTTAWTLLDVKEHKPKLSYEGLEEVDGQELHRLDYRIRKGGGVSRCPALFRAGDLPSCPFHLRGDSVGPGRIRSGAVRTAACDTAASRRTILRLQGPRRIRASYDLDAAVFPLGQRRRRGAVGRGTRTGPDGRHREPRGRRNRCCRSGADQFGRPGHHSPAMENDGHQQRGECSLCSETDHDRLDSPGTAPEPTIKRRVFGLDGSASVPPGV